MVIIGRDPDVDIVLPYPQVSARHASIEFLVNNTYRIRDLGSTNGTFFNDKRITEVLATPMDAIRFGSVPFEWNRYLPIIQKLHSNYSGYSIGREPGNDIVIPDPRVSAIHARAIPKGNFIHLIDCGSSNGIFVNGRKISSADITPVDRVQFGSLAVDVFRFVNSKGFVGQIRQSDPSLWPYRLQEEKDHYRTARKPLSEAAPKDDIVPPSSHLQVQHSAISNKGIIWAVILFTLFLGVGAFAYYTREDVIKNCEACGKEIYREKPFIWAVEDAKRRAVALHWCQACGDEEIPYTHASLCLNCGRPYEVSTKKAKRLEQKKNEEVKEGYCSPSCKGIGEAKRTMKEMSEGAGKLVDKLTEQFGKGGPIPFRR
jgi:pSer/pThr/pTyr-binding forkhead associated (FHA) protein